MQLRDLLKHAYTRYSDPNHQLSAPVQSGAPGTQQGSLTVPGHAFPKVPPVVDVSAVDED